MKKFQYIKSVFEYLAKPKYRSILFGTVIIIIVMTKYHGLLLSFL